MNQKNGALTFAFTVAGACLGYSAVAEPRMVIFVALVAAIGGMAAAFKED